MDSQQVQLVQIHILVCSGVDTSNALQSPVWSWWRRWRESGYLRRSCRCWPSCGWCFPPPSAPPHHCSSARGASTGLKPQRKCWEELHSNYIQTPLNGASKCLYTIFIIWIILQYYSKYVSNDYIILQYWLKICLKLLHNIAIFTQYNNICMFT